MGSFTFFIEPSNKVYPTTTQPSITIHAAPNPTLSTIMPTKVDPNAQPNANNKLIVPNILLDSFLPNTSVAINAGADIYEYTLSPYAIENKNASAGTFAQNINATIATP